MISVSEEAFVFGAVWKASGTSKDVKLWFSVMISSHEGSRGGIIKLGDNAARATIEVPKRKV